VTRLRRTLIALTALLALSGLALALLLWTSVGLSVAVSLAESFAGLAISSQNLRGNLARGIAADQLDIELPGISVSIQDLSSDWEIGISDRSFNLDTLQIGNVSLILDPMQSADDQADNASPIELPEIDLGIALNLNSIAVDTIEWTLGDTPPGASRVWTHPSRWLMVYWM
jgi:autotransporter translocation and assembly factor TamB